MSVAISINQNTASPALAELLANLRNPRPVLEVGANAIKRTLQDWFRSKPRNSKGWPSRGFWRSQSRATAVQSVTDTEAVVSVSDPDHPGAIAHRLSPNNPVTPKRGKYLALPVIAEAYAAGSPREGGAGVPLALIIRRISGRVRAVGIGEDVRTSKRTGRQYAVGRMWYSLVTQVSHSPDSTAIPSQDTLAASARLAMSAFLTTRYGARTQIGRSTI